MSTRAGTLAVVVALGLIAIALVLFQTGKRSPTPATNTPATPEIRADEVQRVTIATRTDTRVVRRNERGGWSLELTGGSWPVDPQPIDSLLRIVTGLAADPDAASQQAPASDRRITITLDTGASGAPPTFAFGDTPVAGRVVALRAGKPFAFADARIVDIVTRPGPMGWRSLLLVPDNDARGAARIAISTGAGEPIELARLEGVWRMRRPMSARANPDAVTTTLEHLAATKIIEFTSDAGTPPTLDMTTGATDTRRTIELAWDQRSAAPDGSLVLNTIVRRIVFDGAPPGQNDRVRATVDGPAPAAVTVRADAPMGISTAARNYLADTATGVAPADVGFVRLRSANGSERGFRREGTGWTTLPDGKPANGEPIESLLKFLADQSGEPQESFRDSDIRSVVRIELLDFEAEPIEFLDAGYTADGVLAVRSGTVVWLYSRLDPPEVLGIPAFASLPPVPDAPKPDTSIPVSPK